MYSLRVTGQFKKDVKRCAKRGYPLEEMWSVIRLLLNVGFTRAVPTASITGWVCRLLGMSH